MKVLVLSPHTDDGELGCGGTMAKFVEEGAEVAYLAFSSGDRDRLRRETRESMKCLGVVEFEIYEFEIRRFLSSRQNILQLLYDYDQENELDFVLVPSTLDLHQDHQVITKEAMRAFRTSTILGYELPWNNIRFITNYFVSLTEVEVVKKIEALKCYQSQSHKYYFHEDFLRSVLRTRGTQIQTEFAEAFETIKVIR